ncbi:MAG: hypothetical protein HWE16_00350 [Gammaproteobacteria bacterium]|nr:hypothetical protein [Gammaproteobacteria bacterium]
MIKFQGLSKFTIGCYILSILIIGLVMAEQFLVWQWLSKETKITLLIIAAIVGVSGSIYSIAKQLKQYLKNNDN